MAHYRAIAHTPQATQFTMSSHYIHSMCMYMWYIHTVQHGIARPFIQVIDYTLLTVENKISQDISGYLWISHATYSFASTLPVLLPEAEREVSWQERSLSLQTQYGSREPTQALREGGREGGGRERNRKTVTHMIPK